MNLNEVIFVAGHRGLVGAALVRRLSSLGYSNIEVRSKEDLDLTCQATVDSFFYDVRPKYVFLAAARVGGIMENDGHPAEFLRDNLAIEINVIDAAYRCGAQKLLFLGSNCIYPKYSRQPISEDCLLTGPLEPTNEWYAIAKIAGIKMGMAYRRQYGFDVISAMPCNLYGPGDDFSYGGAHVLPALLRKLHEAKESGASEVEVWGTGAPRREFLHVDDLADACVYLMTHYSDGCPINVGSGSDITIRELAERISRVVEFNGELRFDSTKPDGTPRKLMDITRLHDTGWLPKIDLEAGIRATYDWYRLNLAHVRGASGTARVALQSGA